MRKSKINQITKISVDILLCVCAAAVIAVPLIAKYLCTFYGYGGTQKAMFMAILYSSGICSAYILLTLRRMFKTLLGGNPFTQENIVSFRRMAAVCAVIALICLIKCFVLFSWGTIAVSVVFVLGTLFCLTLKNIFEQAIEYKRENDLTV